MLAMIEALRRRIEKINIKFKEHEQNSLNYDTDCEQYVQDTLVQEKNKEQVSESTMSWA